eukprot:CAMPEP_0195062492 /NCGR_PEP_ID=MMETSP0448-20130528/9100_1 /TAXON_ID=66468 /ORGANISM="Heterocapsa triquestra, Strain CCMP 448" /LENGTH=52 /DNA_ID=CAMNT_0040093189 /DNA_START=89 /DNA_END=244 /DNA_ORIENTATION=+
MMGLALPSIAAASEHARYSELPPREDDGGAAEGLAAAASPGSHLGREGAHYY